MEPEEALEKEDWQALLHFIPEDEIEKFSNLFLDLGEVKNIEDFSDSELLEELNYRGLNRKESTNIIDDNEVEEVIELFLGATREKRNEILKLLKD